MNDEHEIESKELERSIEGLLFVCGKPITRTRLTKVTKTRREEVDRAIESLQKWYNDQRRGLTILIKEDKVQLASHPDVAEVIEALVKDEMHTTLSQASLEVLSIIAYRGPITRTDIEAIRGVNCSYTIRALLMRALIEREKSADDSRGYVYKVSFDFLETLGIAEITELPEFEKLSIDERIEKIIQQEQGGHDQKKK